MGRAVREKRERDAKARGTGRSREPPGACPERSRRVAKDAKAKRRKGTREWGQGNEEKTEKRGPRNTRKGRERGTGQGNGDRGNGDGEEYGRGMAGRGMGTSKEKAEEVKQNDENSKRSGLMILPPMILPSSFLGFYFLRLLVFGKR